MKAIVSAVLAVSVWIGQAQAADTIVQNRDEPGRHPVQQMVAADCSGGRNCVCQFPTVGEGYRYVITSIDAVAALPMAVAEMAYLYGSGNMSPPVGAINPYRPPSFSMSPHFGFPLSFVGYAQPSYYYALHESVTAYFGANDAPTLEVDPLLPNIANPPSIITSLRCTISGYAVAFP